MVDLIVAGGGPAGLASAIGAAQSGMAVTLVEPKAGTIDKACGEGLMPPALKSLSALGVPHPSGIPFAGIRYVDGDLRAQGNFSAGPGMGVRRTALHDAMRARAKALGVQRVEGKVGEWTETQDGIEVNGISAKWMIAADGLHSPIRKRLGLGLPSRLPDRLGVRRHFQTAPWSEFVEVHWSERAEAYVTPVAPDTVGVAILFYPDALPPGSGPKYNRLLSLFPELEERLRDPCTPVAGAGPFAQHLSSHRHGRILLVGDASGYVDPLTGEGIRMGLDTAEAAVSCLRSNQPAHYDRAWRRVTWRYRWMTSGLLEIRSRPWLRRQLVPTLRRCPWLLRGALDILNGPVKHSLTGTIAS